MSVHAAPYVPSKDSEVLERLPSSLLAGAGRELRALRAALGRDPTNLALAVRTAQRYIQESRAQGDPRYLGYAQSALGPWWSAPTPPDEVLVLRATIRQSQHDFEAALGDLAQLLKNDPAHAQGWLTRATVLQVRGEYAEAARSCRALSGLAPPHIATVCLAGVAAMTGQAESAYRSLREAAAQLTPGAASERLWIETTLAEVAARLGRPAVAEDHFRRALDFGPKDPYLKGAYADFLLDAKRPREVLRLLADDTRIDGLLLRLALAERIVGAPESASHVAALDARFKAARTRGDRIHQREEARFQLGLLHKPEAALKLAQENWRVQKESADARILLEAAIGAGQPSAAKPVLDWMTRHGVEDVVLVRLAEKLRGGR